MARAKDERKRAVLYVRQSLDSNGDGAAVARQEQACRDLCARRGWTVTAVYADNDVSATRRRTRPEWSRMLHDAENDDFDVIVAYQIDRLTRTLRDLLPLIDLGERHGIAVATVSGDLDTSTDAGQMVATVLTGVANMEVKRKAARQMLANAQRAQAGKVYKAGAPVFGYEADRATVVPSEAALIRDGYASLLSGSALSSIARDWTAAGTTTRQGRVWGHGAVRGVLGNPRYAGHVVYQGAALDGVVGQWEPIISTETFEAAHAILSDPARRTNHTGGERRRLLTGSAFCGVCDDGVTTVNGAVDSAGVPAYRCRTAKHLLRRIAPLDDYVRAQVIERLGRPDAVDLLVDKDAPDLPALTEQARALRSRLKTLADAFADGAISDAQLRTGSARARASLAKVEQAMAHRDRAPLLKPLVDAEDEEKRLRVWESLSVDRRRSVLDAMLTVTILRGKPGGGLRGQTRPVDPRTLRLEWHA